MHVKPVWQKTFIRRSSYLLCPKLQQHLVALTKHLNLNLQGQEWTLKVNLKTRVCHLYFRFLCWLNNNLKTLSAADGAGAYSPNVAIVLSLLAWLAKLSIMTTITMYCICCYDKVSHSCSSLQFISSFPILEKSAVAVLKTKASFYLINLSILMCRTLSFMLESQVL